MFDPCFDSKSFYFGGLKDLETQKQRSSLAPEVSSQETAGFSTKPAPVLRRRAQGCQAAQEDMADFGVRSAGFADGNEVPTTSAVVFFFCWGRG